ncbi:MAG: CoA-binding protein [Promethearchaeota archaeon]
MKKEDLVSNREHTISPSMLHPIFYPEKVAVVGVSTSNMFNPGTVIFQKNLNIKGYLSDNVYGVNPKGGAWEGINLYKNLLDIPSKVDLAVLSVRASHTVQAFKDAVELGIKGAIIISGGFSESGAEGKKLQRQIREIALDNNVPVIGPNCVGVYNPGYINTFFIPQERFVLPKSHGNVSIVSQSGGIMADQGFCKFFERGIALAKAISLGNKAVIDEVDLLGYFTMDPQTDVIGFYVEGFSNGRGRDFLLKSRETNKSIIVLKGGKTERGKKAASSHTAAIASNNLLMKGALKQFSIINCESEQELIAYTKAFSLVSGKNKPFFSKAGGGKLAIITVSGGHGVIASDLSKKYDMKLVEFTHDEKDTLRNSLNGSVQKIASVENPIDLTGSCTDDDIVNTLEILTMMDKVDLILLNILPYPPGISLFLGSRIAAVVRRHKKPVICYLPYLGRYEMMIEALTDANIPVGNSIEESLLMAHAVQLKSQAIARARVNKMVDVGKFVIEQYGEFKKKHNNVKKINIF